MEPTSLKIVFFVALLLSLSCLQMSCAFPEREHVATPQSLSKSNGENMSERVVPIHCYPVTKSDVALVINLSLLFGTVMCVMGMGSFQLISISIFLPEHVTPIPLLYFSLPKTTVPVSSFFRLCSSEILPTKEPPPISYCLTSKIQVWYTLIANETSELPVDLVTDDGDGNGLRLSNSRRRKR
ncbi:unnamed protein product [Lactuca virosa]|uniref:Uncharacterized protein n=1 Tax=Lactuca virosa TaxID=75947 RepID=A0AAU9MTP5_9ASTR|nr:unnamed protein product [Lactuca virosa]